MTTPTTLSITVPQSAQSAAASQRTAEVELKQILSITEVSSPETYAVLDSILTDVVRDKDAAERMRKQATDPLYEALRTIGEWFRPWIQARKNAEERLKILMGRYRVAQAQVATAARQEAADAAMVGDSSRMLDALEVAAAVPPEGRATVSFRWAVKRIAADLLPDEWWAPDMARIEEFARAAGTSEDPPVIPGVIFEREARIGARRCVP